MRKNWVMGMVIGTLICGNIMNGQVLASEQKVAESQLGKNTTVDQQTKISLKTI